MYVERLPENPDLEVTFAGETDLGQPNPTPQDYLSSEEKRAFDLDKAHKALPFAVVGGLAAAAAVACVDGVNPILRQERVGYDGEAFEIIKIKTMPGETRAVPSEGHQDERRSALGRFLSKIRVDESPQLLNILRGEMSVVCPRPLVAAEYATAEHILGSQKAAEWKHDRTQGVRPGAFGEYDIRLFAGQIEGDAEQRLLTRIQMERRYIFETASAAEDQRIFDLGKQIAQRVVIQQVRNRF